jgi:hypothetical protein
MDARVDEADNHRARMATVNRELADLKAALTAAADLNHYQGPRGWIAAKKFPKGESFAARLMCPSSDNLGRLSGVSFGGSGSSLIEVMRFQFGGASAA